MRFIEFAWKVLIYFISLPKTFSQEHSQCSLDFSFIFAFTCNSVQAYLLGEI